MSSSELKAQHEKRVVHLRKNVYILQDTGKNNIEQHFIIFEIKFNQEYGTDRYVL